MENLINFTEITKYKSKYIFFHLLHETEWSSLDTCQLLHHLRESRPINANQEGLSCIPRKNDICFLKSVRWPPKSWLNFCKRSAPCRRWHNLKPGGWYYFDRLCRDLFGIHRVRPKITFLKSWAKRSWRSKWKLSKLRTKSKRVRCFSS